MNISSGEEDWRSDIIKYLTKGLAPKDSLEAKVLRMKAARYTVIASDLYKRGFVVLLLKCLSQDQANYTIRELHEGICEVHSGSQTRATRVIRAGYYQPTLRTNFSYSNFVQGQSLTNIWILASRIELLNTNCRTFRKIF